VNPESKGSHKVVAAATSPASPGRIACSGYGNRLAVPLYPPRFAG